MTAVASPATSCAAIGLSDGDNVVDAGPEAWQALNLCESESGTESAEYD